MFDTLDAGVECSPKRPKSSIRRCRDGLKNELSGETARLCDRKVVAKPKTYDRGDPLTISSTLIDEPASKTESL